MADELRKHDLLPIMFDSERSTNRDFTETIRVLAGLSLFVVADITKPKSIPQELTATVPNHQIPFIPILQAGEEPYSMFRDLINYDRVLKPVIQYSSKDELLGNFEAIIPDRGWKKHQELQGRKTEVVEAQSIQDFLRASED